MLEKGVSLAEYVSWKSSGPAKTFFQPENLSDLQAFLKNLDPTEPLLWLGLGSNLLIREGGFEGTVIWTQKHLRSLFLKAPYEVYAEAGVACPTLARFAAREGLAGAEWFAGIPGTVGGALAMNAGAFKGETWKQVVSVDCLTRQGELITRTPADFSIDYRTVISHREEWFVGATFRFEAGNKEESLKKIQSLLATRASTQPTGLPSCGSVFRNPPGEYAGRLIEQCGLKGYRIGDAIISEKHANFILNLGQAKPSDLEALIKKARELVYQETGILLEPEVRIVGNS